VTDSSVHFLLTRTGAIPIAEYRYPRKDGAGDGGVLIFYDHPDAAAQAMRAADPTADTQFLYEYDCPGEEALMQASDDALRLANELRWASYAGPAAPVHPSPGDSGYAA
jgi:hypothetical protein